MTKQTKRVMFALFDPQGNIEMWSLSESAYGCRRDSAMVFESSWKLMYKFGWRVKKVELQISVV